MKSEGPAETPSAHRKALVPGGCLQLRPGCRDARRKTPSGRDGDGGGSQTGVVSTYVQRTLERTATGSASLSPLGPQVAPALKLRWWHEPYTVVLMGSGSRDALPGFKSRVPSSDEWVDSAEPVLRPAQWRW